MSRKTLLIPICFCTLSMSVNAGTVVVNPNETYNTNDVRKIAFDKPGELSVTFTDGTSRSYELTSFQRIYFTEGSSTESFSPLGNKEMYLYPNPVTEVLYVKGIPADSPFEIYDIQGVRVLGGNCDSEEISLSVHSLPKGNYFMKVADKVLKFIRK